MKNHAVLSQIFAIFFILPKNSDQVLHDKNLAPTLEVGPPVTECGKDRFTTTLKFDRNFNGIVYAKGFPYAKDQKEGHRCYTVGNGKDKLAIALKPSQCGVRLTNVGDGVVTYAVTLIVQTDKLLQQFTNFEVQSNCHSTMDDGTERRLRSGKSMKSSEGGKILRHSRAWLELALDNGGSQAEVGEPLKLLMKASLPAPFVACASECLAYDGLSERKENLTDNLGCSYDENLLPTLRPLESLEGENSIQTIGSTFSAFKFAESANLHISCTLNIYKYECPPVLCGEVGTNLRSGRSLDTHPLEKIEIFNSIEVRAPGIDGDVPGPRLNKSPLEEPSLCLSMTDIAIHLALLGSIVFVVSMAIFIIYWRSTNRKVSRSSYASSGMLASSSRFSDRSSQRLFMP